LEETVMTTSSTTDCALCIDGVMPAGVRDVLGPVVKPCPTCVFTCGRCDGAGVFPATQHCLDCFVADLADQHGLAPVLCAGCQGVIALVPYPFDTGRTP
jgi:hypothetical protein